MSSTLSFLLQHRLERAGNSFEWSGEGVVNRGQVTDGTDGTDKQCNQQSCDALSSI